MDSAAVLRPLREDDAEEVVALYHAAFGDERPIDAQEIVSWLGNPEVKNEWLRVLELDGRIVGHGDIWIDNDEVELEAAAPGHWQTLFDWAEGRARQRDDGGVPPSRACCGLPRQRSGPESGPVTARVTKVRLFSTPTATMSSRFTTTVRPAAAAL